MLYTLPDYQTKFVCLASDCPATCCEGWQIVIDNQSLEKYKSCKGGFGNRLANSIDWNEKAFLQYHGRCAFLNEENLCDLHLEAGADMMCRTCRSYPRHTEVYENEREIMYSVSCPAVARMVLSQEEKLKFVQRETRKEEPEDPDFDFFLYSALQEGRSLLFCFLQDRSESIKVRMAKALALTHDVQNHIDTEHIFEVEEVLERYGRKGASDLLKKKLMRFCGRPVVLTGKQRYQLLRGLRQFEVLDKLWMDDCSYWMQTLYGKGWKYYEQMRRTFRQKSGIKETEYEQLMIYFLFTYYCGAVYDGDALSKMKMAVVSILILEELFMAVWMLQGQKLDQEDRARIVWRYARELEHSDQNLNQMEHWMNHSQEAKFSELLFCLMESEND